MSPAARLPHRLTRVLAALALGLGLGLLTTARADGAKKKQEIVWAEIPHHGAGDAPFALAAHATSKLKVEYELVSGPADLDGNLIKLSGQPGLVIVRATQKGNDLFLPAPIAERVIQVGEKPSAPVIVEQPTATAAGIGQLIMLSVEVRGEPEPTLQWQKDGINLSGATERTLTFSSATQGDAGRYTVMATNPLGSVLSAAARVAVGKLRQTIQFQTTAVVMSGQPILLNATSSSGLEVRYTLVSGTGSISGNTLTAQSGTISVEADQPGDGTYEPAMPVTQTFQIQAGPGGQFR